MVNDNHDRYLKNNELEEFKDLQIKLKMYYPNFNIEEIEDIDPYPV